MPNRRRTTRFDGTIRGRQTTCIGGKNLPKDFEALVDELRILKAAEEEAEKIVENARKEAEKIIREAEEQSAGVMSGKEEEIRKAAREVRQKAEAAVASEIDGLEQQYVSDVKKMKNKASENTDEAVAYIFDQVLKTKVARE